MLLPLGRRRSSLDHRIAAAYLAGNCLGGTATAAVAWVLSGFLAPLGDGLRLGLLGVASVVIVASKHGPLSRIVPLPENRRQIPSDVFSGGLVRGALRFGLELGTGVRTYVPSAAPYLLAVGIVLAGLGLAPALLAGMAFGVGRAMPLLVGVIRSRDDLAPAATPTLGPRGVTLADAVVLAGVLRLAA